MNSLDETAYYFSDLNDPNALIIVEIIELKIEEEVLKDSSIVGWGFINGFNPVTDS
jgi:hypothetical protein